MTNFTIRVDEDVLKKAEKIAIDMDATVSDLVCGFLAELVARDSVRREFVANELDHLFERSTASSGGPSGSARDSLDDPNTLRLEDPELERSAPGEPCSCRPVLLSRVPVDVRPAALEAEAPFALRTSPTVGMVPVGEQRAGQA